MYYLNKQIRKTIKQINDEKIEENLKNCVLL